MAKTYYVKFGSGDPRVNTGLSPTFVIFSQGGLTAIAGPTITEKPAGSGMYQFVYGPTMAVAYLMDGMGSLGSADRYISGVLDPIQAVDQQIGFITDIFGTTGADPSTLYGYFRRFLEMVEGNQVFTKATGVWQMFNRGSSTLLRTKSMTDTLTSSTRTGSG